MPPVQFPDSDVLVVDHDPKFTSKVLFWAFVQSMGACLQPPWLSWQGESWVQSFDLDGVGSIPDILPMQNTCFSIN